MWGGPLKREDYLKREEFLMTVPLAKNGGVTHWILTDRQGVPDQRPIYASCETLRKRAVCSRLGADGEVIVQEGTAHNIGSVFTNPAYRGKGYASRMMADLGPVLKEWSVGRKKKPSKDEEEQGTNKIVTHSLFSTLYSDIGKTFYATHGWAPFESSHFYFKPATAPANAESNADGASPKVKKLGYHDLAKLCYDDENVLRKAIEQRAKLLPSTNGKTKVCAALIPDLDQFLWHMMREDFITKHIFGKTPEVRGALYGEAGQRVWAVWVRGYYGNVDNIKDNTFYILRFVVEDEEKVAEEYVAEAFSNIMRLAQEEAREWRSFDIQLWNPSPLLKSAAAKSGLEHTMVDRETSSIPSLMWYGEEETAAVDWVLNEKYAWG
jgi:GNAT superfamily N-acetyltransferase